MGIRNVAAEADVAVTTVFAHFASKEALVFERDQDFQERLTRAVTDRAPHEPLIAALHREVRYEESMSLRHAQAPAETLASDPHRSQSSTACKATARFAIDAYALACRADDPGATVDEVFRMIEAAWEATAP